MKKYMTYIATALLLASCSQSEPLTDAADVLGDGTDLMVSSVENVQTQSKAIVTGTSFSLPVSLGLYFRDASTEEKATAKVSNYGYKTGYDNVRYHNYVDNDYTKWSAGTTPIKLGEVKGRLYGYYPYTTSADSLSYPYLTVEAGVDAKDFMYLTHKDVNDQTMEDGTHKGTVKLTMNHALAGFVLKFQKSTTFSASEAKLTGFTLSGKGIATSAYMNIMTGKLSGDKDNGNTAVSPKAFTVTRGAVTLPTTADGNSTFKCLIVPTDSLHAYEDTLRTTINGKVLTTSLGMLDLSPNNMYTITVNVNDESLDIFDVSLTPWGAGTALDDHDLTYLNSINGHDYVEIGGVKWATMNIGATTVAQSEATSFGDWYNWGETTKYYTEVDYTTGTVKTWKDGYSQNGFGTYSGPSADVYDASGIIKLSHDVAHLQWGASWRMPTKADYESLSTACGGTAANTTLGGTISTNTNKSGSKGVFLVNASASSPVTIDGVTYRVKGYLCIASETDLTKRVFFPATGYQSGQVINQYNVACSTWESNISTTTGYDAYFSSDGGLRTDDGSGRWQEAQTIRPVSD